MKIGSIEIFKGLSLFLFLGLAILLSFELRGVLISLFIAFILSAGLRPLIALLEEKGFSRGIAILVSYLFIALVAIILSVVVVNIAVVQLRSFFSNIDTKIATAETFVSSNLPFLKDYIDFNSIRESLKSGSIDFKSLSSSQFFSRILENISFFGGQGISIVGRVFGGLLSVFSIIMISIYMLSNRKSAYEDIIELTPNRYQKKLFPVFKKMEQSLGSWLVGQISLMFIIGFITAILIALPRLFDSNYPLISYVFIIAVIAGLFEGIPNLGPIFTTIITVLIALISGASLGVIIYIVVAFLLLQQIEGIFIVPMVMKKAVDINPILSIAGVLAGFELAGPLGALLAVPIIAMLQIIILELSAYWKERDNQNIKIAN
jgi:predicted PurR-regulated permease PerM